MKTSNPVLENMMETQSQAVKNWMDSTQKFQQAMMNGNLITEGQTIYKEWAEKQASLFGGTQANYNSGQANFSKPEEFFKNWYSQQMENIKKVTDFNQSIYNSMVNFGKNSADYSNSFSSMNGAWTNIYNNWMNTLNTTYDTLYKNIPGGVNQDAFKNLFETSKIYLQLQEFWAPAIKAMQSGEFNTEVFKNYYNPETYKKVSEQMFGNMFNNGNMKEIFDNVMGNLQNYFVNNNKLSKEYAQALQNISAEFPQLISGDFAKLRSLYHQVNDVFSKTFEPLMKAVTPGKEKEMMESQIELLDRISNYSIKNTELHYHFYTTTQKAVENASKSAFEKLSKLNPADQVSFTEFYNEWLKTNEVLFTELFASEEFSKLKGEVMNIGMDLKKNFENQFEKTFNVFPFVFKNDMEEVYKTIYELKKQVKNLETKLAAMGVTVDLDEEEKSNKGKKK